jgi:hypothetical protein
VEFRPRQILVALADHNVDCLVVGGIAAAMHKAIHETIDVDILCEPSEANLERIAALLTSLRARVKGAQQPMGPVGPDLLHGVSLITFETELGEPDIFFEVPGMSSYGELSERAQRVSVSGRIIKVVSRADLIALKRASGRERDRVIVDELMKLGELGAPEDPDTSAPVLEDA